MKPDKGDEDVGNVVGAAARQIFANPDAVVAWAYGSDDEEKLLVLLKSKLGVP